MASFPPPPNYAEVATAAVPPPSYAAAAAPMSSSKIHFILNGQAVTVDFESDPTLTPSTTLVEYIRQQTKFTGTKLFCHEGGCGVCVVALTYTDPLTNLTVTNAAHACLRPLMSCDGMTITTNDGLVQNGAYHPIQTQLAAHNGSQCGFCSNGFVMTMYAMLARNTSLTPLDIEREFDGNLCRCTGYRPILDAMKTFATTSSADAKAKCDEDDCRKTGCKRAGLFDEIEELGKHMPQLSEPYKHTTPKLVKATTTQKAKLSVQANGSIWQDCHTLDDLNGWLPWYVSQGFDPMLVVGQTSLGVYPASPQVRLNIAPISELHQITQDSTGVTVGASCTIAQVLDMFLTTTGDQTYQTAHFPQAAKHFQRIASKPLRNMASVFGNIAVTVKHQDVSNYFCGDGATVLYGLGAQFNLYDTIAQNYFTVSTGDLFNTDLTGKYCLSIFIPWALPNEHFMSYKIAMRQVNAHSYLNAAMRCVVDPTSNTITGSPVIVFGGINSKPTRFTSTETSLVGMSITDVTKFQTVATALATQLSPTVFMGKQAFRKSVALNYFYKFFLFLNEATLPSTLQSGAQCWFTRPESQGSQAFQPNPAEYPVSIGMPKIESIQQTSGNAKYTEDLARPRDCLYASIVFSTQGNCQIDTVDASAAEQMPGFVAFYQASDLAAGQNQWQNGEIFSSGAIAFYGQSIGVVVATTERFAWDCAAAVVVTYKNLQPMIVTIEEAVKAKSYVPAAVLPAPVVRGNATTAMKTADNVITDTVQLGYQFHFHMENHVTLVVPREDVLEVHSATQMPVPLQMQCATVSGYPMSKVIVSVKRCGGGFGGKLTSSLLPASIATICALKLNQPVQVVVDLQQTTTMLGCRGGKIMDYTIGFNNDGTIVALEANLTCAAGAFYQDAGGACVVAMHSLDNAYYIPNANITGTMVTMNIPSITAVRGPGWVPGIHFGECLISRMSSALGMPAEKIREKNFFQKGQTTCDGMILSYWDMQTIWSQLKTSASYTSRVASVEAFNTANRWVKRGLSMVPVRFGVGQTGANFDSQVNIYPDGTVSITHGGSEIGQGIDTKVIQCAAFKLGLTKDDLPQIAVNETCTRSISAGSNVTGGSVTSELCSLSVMHACETLSRRLAPFRQKGQTWQQLIGAASQAGIELSASGFTNAPVNGSGIFNYNSNAAALTEVEIDVLTGQFEVRQVDILFDCGISLNPTIDIGQVEGGFIFGMGYYIVEDPSWDPTTGKPNQFSTWEYKPPCAYDVPLKFNTTLLKNAPNPLGVLGSKATGEPGVALATSVVQALESAITAARSANGLGEQRWVCRQTPLTVDRIQQACGTTIANLDTL